MIPRFHILGSPVDAMNMETCCAAVGQALDSKTKGYVCVAGVHQLTEAYEHPEFRKVLEKAFLVTPDGMPLSWIGWMKGFSNMDRVYGPDLMLEVMRRGVEHGRTHFLYGGMHGVAAELKLALEQKIPGVRIVGAECPPFRPLTSEEETALIEQVRILKPDIIWMGISTPKQDRFMHAYLDRLDTTLMFGVGAAFDFHTGRVKQSPRWMQRLGLEWFYRVCQEPRRLSGRYFRNNPLFIWRLIKEALT
jgi:N-acetylglucosaminyldiphosphoundecaprenol N-acetyl-beta-D-mannosaminyltransferase